MNQSLNITFKENGDVHYHIKIYEFNKYDTFSHIVDFPKDSIELLDDESIDPIYISELPNGKSLIEISVSTRDINLIYIKKGFLKEIDNNHFKYTEKIDINLLENSSYFALKIHTPYSYISALRNKSFAKFNGVLYAPGEISPIILRQSGIMEIDWELEIIEERKKLYIEEVKLNEQKSSKLSIHFDHFSSYWWLDEFYDHFHRNNLNHLTERILHIDITQLLNGSCFYLSAGADITPIVALQDKIRSFVFCDLDLYDSIPDIKNRFSGILIRLKDRLFQQGFIEIQAIKVDKQLLGISDINYSHDYVSKMEAAELSIWKKNELIYSLLYINWDNSEAFHSLYVKNKIIPTAICDIIPDGGTLGPGSKISIPYKYRMPKYSIGHTYSLGKPEDYELITNDIEYFGDYLYHIGENGEKIKIKKGEVDFLRIQIRKDLIDTSNKYKYWETDFS